ncbi:BTB/POZ domain-containing protein POB1 [Cardamine amara subsp. amara]|uniref:BTB/POZ domain-containing protein POB1 n=1 Tax=Cardamine amara subsp. amara TaxID=228776 RepID=A0ABD0ZRL1_CARAN
MSLDSLPLAGIEAILSSDDLKIASEDAVYDAILKWARAQYPCLEERREIIGSRLNPAEDFISKYKGSYTFTGGKAVGYKNLFGIPWRAFIAEDSQYFINGILHLRTELTIKRSTDP